MRDEFAGLYGVKEAPGSIGTAGRLYASLLRNADGWNGCGSNVAFQKGSRHGKLSSFRLSSSVCTLVSVTLLLRPWRHALMLAGTGSSPGQQISRAVLEASSAKPARRGFSCAQTKSPVLRPGFYLNPSNPFRRLRPPRQRRRHRLRHRPRRLRRQLRSPRSWRRGAGSWRAGSRFP